MSRRRAFLSIFSVLAGGAALAGCSNWSFSPSIHGNFMTEPLNSRRVAEAAPPAGGNFIQETAHDYAGLSALLRRRGDLADADYFARKGLKAEHGALVPPEVDGNWAIPLEEPFGFRTKMAEARTRLVADLDKGGRDRFPSLAARAQVSYDCWLERTEDDWTREADGACHKDFLATIAALERNLNGPKTAAPASVKAPEEHHYSVYFDFNRANLTAEARKVVDEVAAAAKSDHAVHVRIVGKADLVGTDPYNMALSHRRADTVRAALIADGIATSRINESWVGFHEPPVPTAPGVREPRNRVVEVTLE
jgi:OmpA-OmpF porin, OOP family